MKGKSKVLQNIVKEFNSAFTALSTIRKRGKNIVCFASSQISGGRYYTLAYDICRCLSEEGYNIITGAGPGIMEACNKGAQKGSGKSIGFSINLPAQQDNPYIDLKVKFKYFFTRKTMFARYADAFIIFPGGFGTLDELFEVLTLIQNKHLQPRPIILVGLDYWDKLESFIYDTLLLEKAVKTSDLKLFTITESVGGILLTINDFIKNKQKNFSRNKYI